MDWIIETNAWGGSAAWVTGELPRLSGALVLAALAALALGVAAHPR